ncbi:MAG: transporter substrate-binding domain-containing protein [Desulfofustis sp. PB-SRB1]|jgi:polar amino acid transport system substrate-binding protein|nr:transporter substrate-binding domain-containing protein [Desulfofustis sp. PB-SRB1]MBM1002413.1 transporter substrate-binding domain-containing protein [Desulfofustis sp. PB-SRB1]HBH29623.1 amino acid ABC transporter substrate-binding protein [Desulfofustis sp.]HBH32776.1 amino acid ABC transporter substrate-binding protein [Desulfofustis sp.]
MKRLSPILAPALILALFLFSAPAIAASINQELSQSSVVEQILKRGVLRVGMDTFQPWAMKDKNGNFIGFEVDVATRLADDMGVRVEFVPTPWSGIIPALLTGKFDVIIGGMGILPQRALKVNFTQPYEFSGMSIVAHKELAAGFDSLEDFNKKEVEIAAKLGTTAVIAAKKHFPQATLRLFENEPQTYQELRNGNVHAVVGSAPRPAFEAIEYSETLFMPVEGTFTKEPIGFALRKGDPDALAFFNAWITGVTHEGWLDERHRYWFGTRDWAGLVE